MILDFPITYRNASVLCQSQSACLHKTLNMVDFFVKSNENTYPKGRALMEMYRVVPLSKKREFPALDTVLNTIPLLYQTSECSGQQHSLDELKRRLEMAELYSQQLSNQNDAGTETLQIVEQLQQERDTLNSHLQQVGHS